MPALEEGNGTGQCDLFRFTYILQARLEGSLGEAEKQEGKGGDVVIWIGGQPWAL